MTSRLGSRFTAIAAALAAAMPLSGCLSNAGTTVTVTVTICPTGKCAGTGSATKSLASGDVATLDASQMSATVSSSGGISGSSGVYTVTLKSAGNTVTSQSFAATRNGNTFTASSPSAVSNWIHGFAGVIDEVDVSMNGFQLAEIDGTNFVTVHGNYAGTSYGSATSSWVHHNNF